MAHIKVLIIPTSGAPYFFGIEESAMLDTLQGLVDGDICTYPLNGVSTDLDAVGQCVLYCNDLGLVARLDENKTISGMLGEYFFPPVGTFVFSVCDDDGNEVGFGGIADEQYVVDILRQKLKSA